MKNLAQAIVKVMKAVKGMEKNSRVGTGNSAYDGTKYQDVAETFNQAMSENGLSMLPIDIEEETKIDRWQEVDPWSKETPKAMKTKQSVFTKVKVKYLLLHESGESQVITGYGHGIDSQDKGAGKATTYALKNTLLYTFLTPVGKIDDSETTHSNDIKTPPKKTKSKQPKEKYNFGTDEKLKWVNDAQVAAMKKAITDGQKESVISSLSKYKWSKDNREAITKELEK